MKKPIAIFGELNRSFTFHFGILSFVLAFIAAEQVVVRNDDLERTIALYAFLPLVIIGIFLTLKSLNRLTLLSFSDTGFTLKSRNHKIEYKDSDLLAVSSFHSDFFVMGNFAGFQHKGEFVLANTSGISRQPFDYIYKAAFGDPLYHFYKRNLNRLIEQASENLELNIPLPGLGWRLSNQGLFVESGEEVAFLSWAEIATYYLLDGEIRVWKYGEEEASLCIKHTSLNANVLLGVLYKRLGERSEIKMRRDSSDSSSPGLGRKLFERKLSSFVIRLVKLFECFLICLLATSFAVGIGRETQLLGILVGISGNVFGIYILYNGLFGGSKIIVYEKGFNLHYWKKENIVRYEQIDKFSWVPKTESFHGVYICTSIKVSIVPLNEAEIKPFRFTFSHQKGGDSQFDDFRDNLARLIGYRMSLQIRNDKSLAWCSKLVFNSDALSCPKIITGFMKTKSGTIPYREISNFNMERGVFYLYQQAKPKAVLKLNMKAMNFYPGYFCLQWLIQASNQGSLAVQSKQDSEEAKAPQDET
ncbi:hypothetical protein KIH39_00705 [Telmatocola sphagniphila]|uniref:Uncharacterized protein n=1 Tax=Telmatocola sphagniphila TaxID=1123043 RepID=A0A8E6B724_9BACT|nr:hypothetical protein [Telmatocola sphagniphila]QVL32469.1 hypothetical protein KIH39_00705 [Telmatocola sphagniphila]